MFNYICVFVRLFVSPAFCMIDIIDSRKSTVTALTTPHGAYAFASVNLLIRYFHLKPQSDGKKFFDIYLESIDISWHQNRIISLRNISFPLNMLCTLSSNKLPEFISMWMETQFFRLLVWQLKFLYQIVYH